VRQRSSSRSSTATTLADVARLAGVSPSTVSRVMNEPWLVRDGTLRAVEQAIAQTGYTPNLLAGGLASNRTRLVFLIVPSIGNSIFSETVSALTERLSQAGYQTLVGLSGYAVKQEEDLLRAIVSRRPDGVVLTGTLHTPESRRRLVSARIPVVETWDLTADPIDMVVGFSQREVGRAVADYLVGKGYRRFGFISAGDQRAEARADGVRDQLHRRGLKPGPAAVVAGPTQLSFGREGLAQLLADGAPPEVVVCSSDTLAHGALAEAQSRGLEVPGDIAVMGFGDLHFSAHTAPALSTVHIDGAAIGRTAADLLLARAAGEGAPPTALDVGFTLVPRESA
jgi:LacI family gluconate utilization system Gnt-I transcriptional repressor